MVNIDSRSVNNDWAGVHFLTEQGMPIHKLAEGPVTITVASVETVQGNFGPQVKFTSEEGFDVYVNELPAQKQLARLNLTMDDVAGKVLHLEQVKKNGTTFTNISLAGSGSASAPRAAAPAQAPVSKQTVGELASVYAECVAYAIATLGTKCEEAGIHIDAAAIQAAAATLFIKATR